MERVSTVGYYAIKQCLIGFITEREQSRCSVCAVTMPNCSADKGLKAVPIRGVSESPPRWRSICNLGQCSRLEHSVHSRRRGLTPLVTFMVAAGAYTWLTWRPLTRHIVRNLLLLLCVRSLSAIC